MSDSDSDEEMNISSTPPMEVLAETQQLLESDHNAFDYDSSECDSLDEIEEAKAHPELQSAPEAYQDALQSAPESYQGAFPPVAVPISVAFQQEAALGASPTRAHISAVQQLTDGSATTEPLPFALPMLSPEQQVLFLAAQAAALSSPAVTFSLVPTQQANQIPVPDPIPAAALQQLNSWLAGSLAMSQSIMASQQQQPRSPQPQPLQLMPLAAVSTTQASQIQAAALQQALWQANMLFATALAAHVGIAATQQPFAQPVPMAVVRTDPTTSIDASPAFKDDEDEDEEPTVHIQGKVRRPYRHESFPQKLYRMLVEVEEQGKDDIVSFIAEGRAFEIHRPDAFEEDVISKYFRHKSLASFRRQLSMYGFKKLREGPGQGGYAHELFLRGQPDLLPQLKRVAELDLIAPPSGHDE